MGSRWKGSIEPGSMPRAAPVLRHARSRRGSSTVCTRASSPTSTAGCGASPATRSSAWTCSRSRGSTRRRWCSSRCTWSCARPRSRSRSSRTARAGSATTSASGWFSPFKAAWINLRAMFIYGSDFFLFKPGLAAHSRSGCCSRCPLSFGDRRHRTASTLSLNWQFLGVAILVVGCQSVLPRLRRPGAVRLHRAATAPLAAGLPVHPHGR